MSYIPLIDCSLYVAGTPFWIVVGLSNLTVNLSTRDNLYVGLGVPMRWENLVWRALQYRWSNNTTTYNHVGS